MGFNLEFKGLTAWKSKNYRLELPLCYLKKPVLMFEVPFDHFLCSTSPVSVLSYNKSYPLLVIKESENYKLSTVLVVNLE